MPYAVVNTKMQVTITQSQSLGIRVTAPMMRIQGLHHNIKCRTEVSIMHFIHWCQNLVQTQQISCLLHCWTCCLTHHALGEKRTRTAMICQLQIIILQLTPSWILVMTLRGHLQTADYRGFAVVINSSHQI